jgi:hypothetical protein
MSERENGQLPLAKRPARSRISADIWEQIKTAHAGGIGLREIARNMNIPAGTVLAHAKREGWTQQIKSATALAKREDTPPGVTPMEAVASMLSERKDKSRLHLSKYVVDASKRAADSNGNLKIARQVRYVAGVKEAVWPAEKGEGGIDVSILSICGNISLNQQG